MASFSSKIGIIMVLSTLFARNRAEELPNDLWGSFVLPTTYESFNLLSYDKATLIVGGRGTGKTSFLKYHCYQTQMSKKRTLLTEDDIKRVGIYWKPDTYFAKLFDQNFMGDIWKSAFSTYVGLSLVIELSRMVQTFVNSNFEKESVKNELLSICPPRELTESLNIPAETTYADLEKKCNGTQYKFENWTNNPRGEPPVSFDGRSALGLVILDLKSKGFFQNTVFHVFVDEFENLLEEQQKIINTWMKHNDVSRAIFSAAFKKYATVSSDTISKENFQRGHDYRVVDMIEDVYAKDDNSFKVLAAEIVISKLQEQFSSLQLVDETLISDRNRLEDRKQKIYRDAVMEQIRQVFPEKTLKEMALDILQDKSLLKKLKDNINKALNDKKSTLKAEDFIDESFPDASIIHGIVLSRDKIDPKIQLAEFNKYRDSQDGPYKNLIPNYIVGGILYLYIAFPQRVCPIYAGFEKFCLMARNNLRHMLELCHQSFVELENSMDNSYNKEIPPQISVDIQSKAARICSKAELEKISELGPYGQELQKIAIRLGSIFILRQKMPAQSEPEVLHFSLDTLEIEKNEPLIATLMKEAITWNVLQEFNATKEKSKDSSAMKEYMLTPMLSPYFRLTPRKGRKIDFNVSEIKSVFTESDEKFTEYHSLLSKKWKVEQTSKYQSDLFGDIL